MWIPACVWVPSFYDTSYEVNVYGERGHIHLVGPQVSSPKLLKGFHRNLVIVFYTKHYRGYLDFVSVWQIQPLIYWSSNWYILNSVHRIDAWHKIWISSSSAILIERFSKMCIFNDWQGQFLTLCDEELCFVLWTTYSCRFTGALTYIKHVYVLNKHVTNSIWMIEKNTFGRYMYSTSWSTHFHTFLSFLAML